MRILYLAPNIPVPGTHGGSTHVTHVHRALQRRGHEVLLLARRGSTEPGVLPLGTDLFPVYKHLVPAYYLARALGPVRRFAPDVIYERYSAFGLGIAFGRALGVPSVLMTLDRDASPISFHFSDRIVATSDAFIPARYRDKVRLVHWGVDVEGLSPAGAAAVRQQLAPSGEAIALYTGSFHRWHGVDALVEVARLWEGPPLVIALVGDGPDRARIARLAQAVQNPRARVVFVGRVPHADIGGYLAAASVCVAPYAPRLHPIFRVHGMNRDPIKVLEYMALGRPTVTIDIPRMRALFQPGEQVLLYPAEDVAALGAQLRALIEDPALARRVGEAGATLVHARYSWAHHAEELERVFQEVVPGEPSRSP
ncbi:glycosyltransferase family 4 protein [Chondromyces apiculatus]|uniref:Glycosyltransferase n=1 Tax=Chondromyces apiculatus DSM 436 TaxID=1192034 RepID=A0A017TGM4_9BACT|nr:glycosyltransferase family 4 protein [Chondromyces apiculatus]EYF08404.1 Glycosyltransferase [Chondromyces apiculatus DSM 436]